MWEWASRVKGDYLHVVFILHLVFAIPVICDHS